MKLEHTAHNVPEPKAQSQWYVEQLGMKIVRDIPTDPFITFVSDDAGALIEFYRNEDAEIPNYFDIHPLVLHLAFLSDNIEEDTARLVAAGATDEGIRASLPTGDEFSFVRDPWGLSVQLIKRSQPLG